jgi:phosphohistidine phosphatase
MILYIVRHASAVPHGTPGIAEDDRPLTEDGTKKMRGAAAGLKNLGVTPDVILSSPLPRAKQTAEILREICGQKTAPLLIQALAPCGNRSEVYREIRSHKDADSLMLVGHQPLLGEIAGEVAWGSAEHYVELKKGGACALEIEEIGNVPRGRLLWLLTPSILRKAAP